LSIAAAAAVGAPVAGVDLIVEGSGAKEGIVIEVNEQPGLANHEPWPTAERFLDFLFPNTRAPRTQGSGG
jgi:D-alanine-D-alanine ligase-like ATP-grasp enzyme